MEISSKKKTKEKNKPDTIETDVVLLSLLINSFLFGIGSVVTQMHAVRKIPGFPIDQNTLMPVKDFIPEVDMVLDFIKNHHNELINTDQMEEGAQILLIKLEAYGNQV